MKKLADHGFDDITWAFPVILNRIPDAAKLAGQATLRLVADSREAVDALDRSDHPFHVWLKADCGYHLAWAVAALDDCEECDDLRVELTVEEAGRPGAGLVGHLAPDSARRLRAALATALRELGEDPGR